MDIWDLVQQSHHVDPRLLARAVAAELREANPDPRTRQLVAECADVLREWNLALPDLPFQRPEPGPKFPSLKSRVAMVTTREAILRFLREIGQKLTHPVRVIIGRSSALILERLIQRQTEDIDLVDEVPEPIRRLGDILAESQRVHGLHLAHFQSHYLPDGWEARLHSLGDLARLHAQYVDPLDVYVGKLFSRREKDRSDLLFLVDAFSPEAVLTRLSKSAQR